MRRTCMHRELSEILVTLVESMVLRIRGRRRKGGREDLRAASFWSLLAPSFDRVDRRKIWGFAVRTDISQLRIMPGQNSDSPLVVTCNDDGQLPDLRFWQMKSIMHDTSRAASSKKKVTR